MLTPDFSRDELHALDCIEAALIGLDETERTRVLAQLCDDAGITGQLASWQYDRIAGEPTVQLEAEPCTFFLN